MEKTDPPQGEERDHASKRKRDADEDEEGNQEVKRAKNEDKIEDKKEEAAQEERYLVALSEASDQQISEFESIVADPAVMKSIKNGKPWDRSQVDDLVRSAKEDDKGDQPSREYFHWLVVFKGEAEQEARVVGYVGFHPFPYKKALQIRVFVRPSGRGHGSNAVKLAIKKYYTELGFNQAIWSTVPSTNMPSIRLFNSLSDWTYKGEENLYNRRPHKLWVVTPK